MVLANELRIGNFYDQFGNVESVSWSTLKTLEESPRTQIWCKPIQLTEEWLLKFGFSDISEDCAGKTRNFRVFCKSYHVEKCTEQQTIFIYLGSRGWTFKRVGSPLYNYVHELQNLYRWLCGEELTLKES